MAIDSIYSCSYSLECMEQSENTNVSTPYSLIMKVLELVEKLILKLFYYPIQIQCLRQIESKVGYVLALKISVQGKKIVSIPKNSFSIDILVDEALAKKSDKSKVMYNPSIMIFESEQLLDAFIRGLSFGNNSEHVNCSESPKSFLILIRVEGPGNTNPSLRFQMAKLYRGLGIRIKKLLFRITYLEVVLPQVSIIAGNENTKIIES